MQPIRCINLKKQQLFFQFSISALPDISHIPLRWFVYSYFSALNFMVFSLGLESLLDSIPPVLGVSWSRLKWTSLRYRFYIPSFLFSVRMQRHQRLLTFAVQYKNMQPGGIRTKKPPHVALCMVLVVTADNLLINKAKTPLQTTCKSH